MKTLPDGRVVCGVCGTELKPGQPHSAKLPQPHLDYGMLIVVEDLYVPKAHEVAPPDSFSMRLFSDQLTGGLRELEVR